MLCLAIVGPLVATVPSAQAAAGGSMLRANESLTANQFLRPGNGQYTLRMQTDGNLVLTTTGSRFVWATFTQNNPGARVVMQGDGNLVVYSAAGLALWNGQTAGHPGAFLNMQDDGNLVVYTPGLQPLWNSGTLSSKLYPGESLTAGQFLLSPDRLTKLLMHPTGVLILYRAGSAIWVTGETYNNPGARLTVRSEGNMVIYSASGAVLWTSNAAGCPALYLQAQNNAKAVLHCWYGQVWSAP